VGDKRQPHFGTPHRHFARTDSTNTRARELAGAGAPHGTVVTAAEQSEGRGRQGRTWSAPAGKALLYSAVVRPLDERHMLLPLAVPLAVCEAAELLEPAVRCGVKWPNDVLVEGRKLAGVLIEARPQDGWAVVGVGLNLTIAEDEFPAELRDRAVSLFAATGPRRLSPTGLQGTGAPRASEALSERLERWLDAGAEEILAAWRERDALRGREVAWDGGSGVADGVDDRGYLLVVTAGGDRIAVGAGEVHLTRS
jgi:BirA family transcriptional regulator, biotin operon repressor / biotin---[acetyl-CoA-carboxylase] ligase